jgi:uncharacterized lipoprotein YddW (UPF0748 family)
VLAGYSRLLSFLSGALISAFPNTLSPVDSLPAEPSAVPPAPAHEFRAAWLSPVGGGGQGDWPSRPGLPADSQKAELRALLDRAQAMRLNTIIFHVRTAADALYPTPHAPWSAFLTGVSGGDPGYDPLAFVIQEAHARGLQLHAWFNPFRAMLPNFEGRAAPNHLTRTHPEWIRRYGRQTWIDPGEVTARNEVIAAILDVVRRYDIDGVHIDDYFYPYQENERIKKKVGKRHVTVTRVIPFPDDQSWKRYGLAQGWTNRNDWRRHNVDDFVQTLYNAVKQEKPWVLVGISPFGIWRSGVPAGITGLDAYSEIYADSRKWLREGWADYFVPQLYWPLNGKQYRFTTLDSWWRQPEQNPQGRYVWPGLAAMHLKLSGWEEAELASQITTIRETRAGSPEVPGHVHFRISSFDVGDGMAAQRLQKMVYSDFALVPPFPWLNQPLPAAPTVLTPIEAIHPIRQLLVIPGDSVPVTWWLVQTPTPNNEWTSTLHRATGDTTSIMIVDIPPSTPIAVRGINRAGQEGGLTIVQE